MILKKSCHLLALFVCLWACNPECWRGAAAHILPMEFVIPTCTPAQCGKIPEQAGYTQEDSEHVTAILGEDVILRCAFEFPEGIPVPYVIQWQKNGIKIPIYIWYDGYPPHAGEGYEGRVSLTNQASLNLTNVKEQDQGWYECRVYFLNRPPESPKNGTWVYLDVHAPPHFKVKPPEVVYVKVGESVSLPCEAKGTPSPAIVWYKDNLPIEESNNMQILPTELQITNLQQTDIGDYLCMARNREGSVSAISKVIVAGPAVITTPPRNITKLEGEKAEFICEAKALPTNVTHKWFHNGVEISQLSWLETRTLVRRDGTLFVNPTSAEDTGKYTCEVSNGIGTPDTASAYLSVEYPARVTYSPTIQYLPLGLSGVIRCYVQANPPFQFITWTKDRRPFDPNSTPGVVTLNNGSLLFQRVSHEHQGRYRCTPYNIHGTAGTSNVMEVLVREPPMYTIKPKEMYQKSVNKEVKMPCEGIGQPKPSITWRKADGKKLPRDRTFIRGGNITIRGLRKEDHGQYECVLENEIATLVTSTLLLVESTTPHAPTNLSVNTSSFSATLNWLPAYDGGYEQTYVIWYRLADQGESDWRTIRVQPDGATAFTIYNLQSEKEYEFQVLSRNILGDGLFSPIIRAKTNLWDFKSVYPTDSYGSTYIPTIHRPSGPAPGPPHNVTVQKTTQGVLISWMPPKNKSVPVAYYHIDYYSPDKGWKRWGPIKDKTNYLAKGLSGGTNYTFRISAYSLMAKESPSVEVQFNIQGDGDLNRSKAITAGVVGGILFFIAAIVLSVCAVKICNKRKRRKAEKAYMMVTCPVADARNGGHSHGGSPVPLKKTHSCSCASSPALNMITREGSDQSGCFIYLPATRTVLKRDSATSLATAQEMTSSLEKSRIPSIVTWGLRTMACRLALLFKPNQALRAPNSSVPPQEMDSSHEWLASTSPPRAQLFSRAANYSVEREYSRPLGWIGRTAEGKFILRDSGEEGFGPHLRNLHIPSTQAGARTSGLHIIRQSSSSPGQHTSPKTISPVSQPIPTIYSPHETHFQICNTANIGEEHSSTNLHSSNEHSFPSTLSSHSISSAQHTSSYELPSLQTLHKSHQQGSVQCCHPTGKVRTLVHARSMSQDNYHGAQPGRRSEYHIRREGKDSVEYKHLFSNQVIPKHPSSPYERKSTFLSQHPGIHQQTLQANNRISKNLTQQPPLATSSPSRQNRQSEHTPCVHRDKFPVSREKENTDRSGEKSMTYTRNHLLGAVERARNIALNRGGPLRRSAPELGYTSQKLVRVTSPYPSNHKDPYLISSSVIHQSSNPDKALSEDILSGLEREITIASRSRSSITSGSSGRGSSAQGSKAASVTQSCGDSLQGELDFAVVNPAIISTNSYVSRSHLHPESVLSSRHSPGSGVIPIIETFHRIPYLTGDSSHSEPSYPSPGPLDISVDENYEFDSVSHMDSELLDRLQQYSNFPARSRPKFGSNNSSGGSGERGLSDSELYPSLYPRPKKPSKYDNTEARCAALKEEFLRFRQRQQERRKSEELESEC
ncbi:protein turtle-like isoform X17 [Centruroides vittatus]|uniref:protein turtle-like isoform X17 n=1 Tax=Centruroides vittatus TaxID=120091 RepID=UPI00350F9B4D